MTELLPIIKLEIRSNVSGSTHNSRVRLSCKRSWYLTYFRWELFTQPNIPPWDGAVSDLPFRRRKRGLTRAPEFWEANLQVCGSTEESMGGPPSIDPFLPKLGCQQYTRSISDLQSWIWKSDNTVCVHWCTKKKKAEKLQSYKQSNCNLCFNSKDRPDSHNPLNYSLLNQPH